jgi:dUTPase
MDITSNLGDQVKFFVHGDTKPPKRSVGDAGVDIFMPNLCEQFIKDLTEKNQGQPFRWGIVGAPQSEQDLKDNKGIYLYVPAHEDIIIPTYVKTRFPDNIFLKVANKSGVASNQKLMVGAEIIDSSYEGELLIHVFNMSNTLRFLEFGQKLAQVIPIVFDNQPVEIFYDATLSQFTEFKNTVTETDFFKGHDTHRGAAGFGEGTGKE